MESSSFERSFPRLLLGVALIFWGWTVNLPIVGLFMAFVFEGIHWVSLRWDFGPRAHARAWTLAVILMLITAVFIGLSGVQPETVRKFLSWMPMFLFPLQFTQSYGMSETIPLSTFSYFSRRKMEADRQRGLEVHDVRVPFTALYFVIILVFSAAGERAYELYFFPGLMLLVGWAMWAGRGKGARAMALVLAMVLVGVFALVGQAGLSAAHEYLLGLGPSQRWQSGDSNWNRGRTRIGTIGKIKQSPQIMWRFKVEQGRAPNLLKMASYNRYMPSGNWSYDTPGGVSPIEDITGLNIIGKAKKLQDGQEQTDPDEPLYRSTGDLVAGEEARNDLPRISLRGSVRDKSGVPLPGDMHTVYSVVQDMEKNSVGSIRVTPRHAVLSATVRWGGEIDTDGEPFAPEENGENPDLVVTRQESAVLEEIVVELGLREMDFAGKCLLLQHYFQTEFRYTKDLSIDGFFQKKRNQGENGLTDGDTPLVQFLREVKAGHCEYFATATTLLLRQAGVPARYCVGYSVQEYDNRGEYVLRGTHGHAWCRAWDEKRKRWIDVDTTPASWISADGVSADWRQALADFFVRLREDFTVWRTQPENQFLVLMVLSIIGAGVVIWIGWRLWLTRKRISKASEEALPVGELTPLSMLEPLVQKHLGPRPHGKTLVSWLDELRGAVSPPLLDEVTSLHQKWRYDPKFVPDDAKSRMVLLCEELKKSLKNKGLRRS